MQRAGLRYALVAATSAGGASYVLSKGVVHLDSEPGKPAPTPKKSWDVGPYAVWVWGSNRNNTLATGATTNIKSPRPTDLLRETPLRDLVLHERYGAAVDGTGDVWFWGAGFQGAPSSVTPSLRGKKITSLAATSGKLFGLGKSGHIYALGTTAQEQAQRGETGDADPWWYLGLGGLFKTSPGVYYRRLAAPLNAGEKFVQIAAGKNHLLAVTSSGRTFSLAVNADGNSHFQLGLRELSDSLTLIPSLSAISVAQVACGDNTSFARTSPEGRVLGWGQNALGNIGLGANASVEIVPVPSEVVLSRGYPGGTSIKCLDVRAGGNNTFFTVQRMAQGDTSPAIDLLASGSGIAGTLGNGLWSSAQGSPVRVKTVSGLQEYSESLGAFVPVDIRSISISSSPNPHVAATLHTVKLSERSGVDAGIYGNDVMVWGSGGEYQLGNGKRSNIAVPQHLAALRISSKLVDREEAGNDGVLKEARIGSGTLSPMPHSRLQLHSGVADALNPLTGKVIKRGCKVEQQFVAGWNASAVYWKVVD